MRFHRPDRQIHGLGDFIVRFLPAVAEIERDPLRLVEAFHRPIEEPGGVAAGEPFVGAGAGRSDFPAIVEGHVVRPPLRDRVERLVPGDSVDPRRELRGAAEVRKSAVDSYEDVLRDVLRLGAILQHAVNDGVDERMVLLEDAAKGALVAAARLLDDASFHRQPHAFLHAGMTEESPGGFQKLSHAAHGPKRISSAGEQF